MSWTVILASASTVAAIIDAADRRHWIWMGLFIVGWFALLLVVGELARLENMHRDR